MAHDQEKINIDSTEDRKYTFPSTETYEFLKRVLKLAKGEALDNFPSNKKQYLQGKFEICTVSGTEIIVDQKTKLPLLIQEKAKGCTLYMYMYNAKKLKSNNL